MEEELVLVKPSEEYVTELLAYKKDFLENSDSMDGCGPLRRFDEVKFQSEFQFARLNSGTELTHL